MSSDRKQGTTVFFTGLSAAGKSTIAETLARLLEEQKLERGPLLLDGDMVRKLQSPGLGFSKQDRFTHIRNVAAVAAEETAKGGIAICAVIAPYDEIRKEVRRMVEREGRFVLVYVDTPLTVCEGRDPKGLYAKVRAGSIKQFTGISDPYEAPTDAEVTIDTTVTSASEAARIILDYLMQSGNTETGSSS